MEHEFVLLQSVPRFLQFFLQGLVDFLQLVCQDPFGLTFPNGVLSLILKLYSLFFIVLALCLVEEFLFRKDLDQFLLLLCVFLGLFQLFLELFYCDAALVENFFVLQLSFLVGGIHFHLGLTFRYDLNL